MNARLQARNISKTYGQGAQLIQVLNGVSALFLQNNSYAITGVSGSGKSTLLHLLGGLDKPSLGEVLFNDQDIRRLTNREHDQFLNKHVGFVFQFHYLIKEITVLENIMLPGKIAGMDHELAQTHGHSLLDAMGLASKATSYPTELSGGEQQRVAIARAIFNKPAFLLADEPTGNLDAHSAERIVSLLLECRRAWGLGLIICSHDASVYGKMDTILHLENGNLVAVKEQ